MFSNNQMISTRQAKRLLILDLLGISSLIMPKILAETAGPDGAMSILFVGALAMGYVWVLGQVMKQMQGDYYSYMKAQTGLFLADIFMLFYLFFFLLLSGYALYQFTGLIRASLWPEGGFVWINVLVILLAAYATKRGIEGRARVYEILFWILGIPLLFMLALSIRGVDVNYWFPLTPLADVGRTGRGILTVFLFFLPVVMILFLKPFCRKPEQLPSATKWVVLASIGMNAVIYLILIGTYQSKATSALQRPILTLMSTIKLPGGYFARMDTFLTGIWFFALFALINTGVFYASHILKEIFRAKTMNVSLFAVLLPVFAVAMWLIFFPLAESIYFSYLAYVALPVLVLLPLLQWGLGCIQGRRKNIEED